jgi:hypothetical protein
MSLFNASFVMNVIKMRITRCYVTISKARMSKAKWTSKRKS